MIRLVTCKCNILVEGSGSLLRETRIGNFVPYNGMKRFNPVGSDRFVLDLEIATVNL